jgi:hypothetical protein
MKKNDEGLEYVKLVPPMHWASSKSTSPWRCRDLLQGCRWHRLYCRPPGRQNGQFKPISGGRACFQFGPGAIQHSSPMSAKWTVKVADRYLWSSSRLAPSDYTRVWDKEFLCTFSRQPGGGPALYQDVGEQGERGLLTSQAALHSYFCFVA